LLHGEKFQWIAWYQQPGWKVVQTPSVAVIRSKWPSGFLRVAGICALVLAVCTLLVRTAAIRVVCSIRKTGNTSGLLPPLLQHGKAPAQVDN